MLRYGTESSFLQRFPLPINVFLITSDDSDAWGCGTFTGRDWFQLAWTTQYGQNEHITFMELVPIELSVIVWSNWWCGCHLHCNCDSEAVVHLLLSRYSHNANATMLHLLQCLFLYEAYLLCNAHFSITHSWSGQHISRSFIMLASISLSLTGPI